MAKFDEKRFVKLNNKLIEILQARDRELMMETISASATSFSNALEIALGDIDKASWRAAWLLEKIMEDNDPRVRPLLPLFFQKIDSKKDGHKRELLKILFRMEFDEEQEGMMYDLCLKNWENTTNSSSLRYKSFFFLLSICKKYPELLEELKFYTQPRFLENLSPGIKHSIQKSLKIF